MKAAPRHHYFLGLMIIPEEEIIAAKACKPDIRFFRLFEQDLVAKDFAGKGPLTRMIWGPISLAYEKFLLDKVRMVPGVPRVIALQNYNCLLLSRIYGRGIKYGREQLGADFFPALLKIIEGLHEQGVFHLDLGHKSNVMVDNQGRPAVIDFNSSLYLPRCLRWTWLIRLLSAVDNYAILRLKVKYQPENCSETDKRKVKRFLRLRKFWIFDRLVRKLTRLGQEKSNA